MGHLIRRLADCRDCGRRVAFVVFSEHPDPDWNTLAIAELGVCNWTKVEHRPRRLMDRLLRLRRPLFVGRCDHCSGEPFVMTPYGLDP